VHTALENRVKDGTPVPESMQKWQPLCDRIQSYGGEVFTERQYALTADFRPTEWRSPDAWVRGIVDAGVLLGDRAVLIDWKGLALDTKLPTPEGFTTMGDVRVGDTLFSESGEMCTVVGKSQVKNIKCYKITFDDTSSVVCDENHLWKLHDGSVVNVKELDTQGNRYVIGTGPVNSSQLLVAAPLSLSDAVLPIDPYVLGVWLADGKHSSAEITKPDEFVWEEIKRRGFNISHDYSAKAQGGKCRVHTVLGLRTLLRETGLLKNKHIPAVYLRAGYAQRLDLLRGLMDGDGNVNSVRKQAIFTTTDKGLSDSVMELLCSLGQRPLQSSVLAHGFGLEVTAYPISFRPNGINPFLLPRKADRVSTQWGRGESWRRRVVSVAEIPSVPTQCISVDSKDHTFLCTERMIPTHNTGRPKADSDQLKLFAAFVFHTEPKIDKVSTAFVWLAHNKITKEKFTRADVSNIWQGFLPRVRRLEIAYENDKWEVKPSGLCGWCPVGKANCTFWKGQNGTYR
jgi:hypothetical protein